jgi:hypothetical protein
MELAKTLILKSIGILWFLRRSRAAILSFVMRLVIHLTEGLSCLFNICITSLLGILNRFIASVSIELKLFETLQLNDFLYHTQTLKDINFNTIPYFLVVLIQIANPYKQLVQIFMLDYQTHDLKVFTIGNIFGIKTTRTTLVPPLMIAWIIRFNRLWTPEIFCMILHVTHHFIWL